jgi:hypothetical protein
MTYSLRFKYITDVKTANYQVVAYELVQYDPSGGTFTLTFPANPTQGEVVSIKNTTFDPSPITISSANNVETHVGLVVTSFTIRQEDFFAQWSFDAVNSIWRLIGFSKPLFIPEPWDYVGANLTLGTNTQIPLTFQTDFFPTAVFFQSDGAGNMQCIRPFGGFFDLTAYINFIATGNNQDGTAQILLVTIAGTPTIKQGLGLVSSSAL